jgi:putative flippase GtrA
MTSIVTQIRKYATVGVANTLIGTSLQFAAHHMLAFTVEISGYIGYGAASILSYFLNRYWTFRATSSHRQTLGPFIAQSVVNTFIYGKITGFLSQLITYAMAVCVGVFMVFVVSFFVNRFIFTQKYISIA